MLAAIIEDRENNSWSQLFIKKTENSFSLNGFSITNGVMMKFKSEYLEIFRTFILSNFQEVIGIIDGYDVILDKKNGYYHFFKNGSEDYTKFFLYNSTEATLYEKKSNIKNKKSMMRKIALASLNVLLVFDLAALGFLTTQFFNEDYVIEYNSGDYIHVEENSIFNTINYSYNDIEDVLRGDITATTIRDLIFSSERLNDDEKSYLWNPELIDKVIPYYKDTNFEIISLIRHTNIGIESFLETEEGRENWNGYYAFENTLYLRDYSPNGIKERIRTVGHEYIHLLQVSTTPLFIVESSAELMSREFFLKTSVSNGEYSYHTACNYLKVLMEIVGANVILDSNFCLNSTALQDAVKDYFSEQELNDFLHIMNLSPYYHAAELNDTGYQRLDELLRILYKNKYSKDMNDDSLISAILNNEIYSRVYFNDSLREVERDYIATSQSYSIEDAISKGYVSARIRLNVNKEEFDSYGGLKLWSCISKNDSNIIMTSAGPLLGIYPERDAKFSSVVELIDSGKAEVKYFIEVDATSENYLKLKEMNNISEIIYDLSDGYALDSTNTKIYRVDEYDKLYIESLEEKFEKSQALV